MLSFSAYFPSKQAKLRYESVHETKQNWIIERFLTILKMDSLIYIMLPSETSLAKRLVYWLRKNEIHQFNGNLKAVLSALKQMNVACFLLSEL